MSLVCYNFANKDGLTDFTCGLTPDYAVENDLFSTLEFGDPSDPLFAKAIELITGKTSQTTVCSNMSQQSFATKYMLMDVMNSKLNDNKGGFVKVRTGLVE